MKKQRMEFLFVLILAAALYIVFFTDYNNVVKGISISIYATIILISMYSLILENRH